MFCWTECDTRHRHPDHLVHCTKQTVHAIRSHVLAYTIGAAAASVPDNVRTQDEMKTTTSEQSMSN